MHVLTGIYAVDAMDGAERDDFERHLHRCASCNAEVRGLRETAARLAMAKEAAPPPMMEQRVMAATYRIRQLPPVPGRHAELSERRRRLAEHVLGERESALSSRLRAAAARLRPASWRGWGSRPRLAAVFAAACLGAVVALGVFALNTQHQLDEARTTSAEITKVVGASDARVEKLTPAAGGNVTVVVSADQEAAVVSTRGMRALPSSETYQLWVLAPGGGARSAGLMPSDGRSAQALASGVRAGDRLGITVEPAGGTTRPTTTPVVLTPATT